MINLKVSDSAFRCTILMTTTNKRSSSSASSAIDNDLEVKKLKTTARTSTSSLSTVNKNSTTMFIDDKLDEKKLMCEYGQACYRQQNPRHTAQYDHPCKCFSCVSSCSLASNNARLLSSEIKQNNKKEVLSSHIRPMIAF
jgi:PBZ domain